MAFFKSQTKTAERRESVAKKSLFREYGEALAIALILALVIRAFIIQAFSIPSGSMVPTLLVGDYLLVNKFVYGIRNPLNNKVWIPLSTPKRWDIVVFIFPQDTSKDYIKRVVGLPGINGEHLETPHAVNTDPTIISNPNRPTDSPRDNFGPVVVPPNSYFVMGDNRDHSYDSRFWGAVPMDALRGKAVVIYFSWAGDYSVPIYAAFWNGLKGLMFGFNWNEEDFRVRWSRIGKMIR